MPDNLELNKSEKRTKDEILGIVFSKLKPNKDDVFADIGCHSCKVSAFFSPYVREVYAVDVLLDFVDYDLIKKCKNLYTIKMHGLEFLKKYGDCVTKVFFGGSDRLEEMLEVAFEKGVERFCVNAARVEVALMAKNKMEKLGIFKELLAVNLWKSYKLAGLTAFKPLNPVFIVYGEKNKI